MSVKYMLPIDKLNQFINSGYVILPKLLNDSTLSALRKITQQQLHNRIDPFELEAQVQYPGAPSSEQAAGGKTIRRLQQAYHRHDLYRQCAEHPLVKNSITRLLQCEQLFINPHHHNCIMTKQPEFSSQTNWHRDTRYWQFSNKYLVNAWFALGDELEQNGGMLILPGSHRWDVDADCLDDKQFFIEDHPKNASRLSLAQQVNLNAGDCLLFSAHCFHAAGANQTSKPKYSIVFTYHGENTTPLDNTPSSKLTSIRL